MWFAYNLQLQSKLVNYYSNRSVIMFNIHFIWSICNHLFQLLITNINMNQLAVVEISHSVQLSQIHWNNHFSWFIFICWLQFYNNNHCFRDLKPVMTIWICCNWQLITVSVVLYSNHHLLNYVYFRISQATFRFHKLYKVSFKYSQYLHIVLVMVLK
jgi:hypothetical protein